MIAAVRGEVMVRRPDHVVIDAGGVGYRLTVSAETLKAVPATGREAFLHAELISRDDSLALYGFASEEERDLFGELISVSGVGPKVAIAALSGGPRPRAAAGDRRRRRETLPGGPGDRQADLRADHRRAAREGRRRARGGGGAVGGERGRRPLASPATAWSTSATRRSRPSSCSTGSRATTPELIARAAQGRRSRQGRRERDAGIDATGSARRGSTSRPATPRSGSTTPAPTSPTRTSTARCGRRRLADFVNQAQVTEQLAIFIEAARGRGEPLDHVLLAGPPGLGKTSLAHIVAAEMGVPLVQTAGPALERKADVASFLTALEPGSVFFIDEIHRLGRAVEETLYPAMEDGELPVVLGQGAGARTVTLPLPPFTLVGATTRSGLLTTPLRDRFGVCHRLEHYSPEHLAEIVERSARILEVEIDAEGAHDDRRRARAARRGSPTGC